MKSNLNTSKSYFMVLVCFCFILVIVRVKITHSLFMVFLIWNLFLAYIPCLISTIVKQLIKKISKVKLLFILFVWLLFFPNAPYMVTDFVHLHHSKGSLIWLDIFILFSFSLTGILFAITSLATIHKIIQFKWNTRCANYFSISATFLCGFGIYLGRFLRFNSWDVFTSPLTLLEQSITSLNDSITWYITLSFGSFLYVLLLLFRNLKLTDQ